MKRFILALLLAGVAQSASGEAFFKISKVKVFDTEPKKGEPCMYVPEPHKDAQGKPLPGEPKPVFAPFVLATVSVKEQIKTDEVFAKIYYYDTAGKQIGQPLNSRAPEHRRVNVPGIPVFMKADDKVNLFFPLPKEVIALGGAAKVMVVFGDKQEADVSTVPSNLNWRFIDFPEKSIAEGKGAPKQKRKAAMNPLIEYVIKTGNERQPQITLFMRPPPGMTDAAESKGILALCLLANGIEDMKRKLQGIDNDQEMGGLLKFAADNKLIVICWGSRGLWDPTKNWDEYSKDKAKDVDKTFDEVADAWGRGIESLAAEYGFEPRNILLRGSSGSAQYALRLALRKPEYFLAVHAHIPSSFDMPTPEARRVLWCLTTGELESGYERSLRFYHACRRQGYPIIYKAIVGLGHQWHPNAEAIGMRFFEWALTKGEGRIEYEKMVADQFSRMKVDQVYPPGQPWIPEFRSPPYVGDVINQEMFPAAQVEMVPAGFRVCLPTETIAKQWNRK